MKINLDKFIILVWMCFITYFLYTLFKDVHYMMELMHAYLKMISGHIGH
jgi:hypothetical protein